MALAVPFDSATPKPATIAARPQRHPFVLFLFNGLKSLQVISCPSFDRKIQLLSMSAPDVPQASGDGSAQPISMSAIRSPMITVDAMVLPVETRGMTDASAIDRPSIPWTEREPSTTAIASLPILQVQL